MGFRMRKSINLGGGFRVNLSKSGVGYSWGGKGYRVTKTATGRKRTTLSIPGTGISYSRESGSTKTRTPVVSKPAVNKYTPEEENYYDTRSIKNGDAVLMVSQGLEEMLAAANAAYKRWRTTSLAFFASLIIGVVFPPLFLLTIGCLGYGIYLQKTAIIDIEYTFDEDTAADVSERMKPLLKIASSKKLWWISQTSKIVDKKYAAGASNSVKREKCKADKKAPFPFKTNSIAVSFSSGNEILLFLPDKVFIFQGAKIGALDYSEVVTSVKGQRFIEEEAVPKDAQIVDYTWKYVNKSGGPDKRFQNNKRIPVCMYGKMEVRSEKGMNTDIMFSNPNIQ